MPRPACIDIDLNALAHNARLTRTLAGSSRVLAAVKADAYGHGMLPCAKVVAPLTDGLAVAHCEEALELRAAGITQPVVVLEGPFDRADIDAINSHGLGTVIHCEEQLQLISQHPLSVDCPIWLKVDTGMHRLGLSISAVDSSIERLTALGHRNIILMSHLAMAEDPEAEVTQHQLKRWNDLSDRHELHTSLMNSAALLGQLPSASDWIRPGYMLYGGVPGHRFENVPTQAVMTLRSEVMAVRDIASGESVGYGARWRAERDSRIATVAVGYGDGYPRTADNGTPVLIDGHRFPLVGRVSMDMLTVDITDAPHLAVGAQVELWGKHLGVDEVARHAGTIGYELVTRLTARLPRNWLQATQMTDQA